MNVLGVMSGTSLDGVDTVLARFLPESREWKLLDRESAPYPEALRQRLQQAIRPETSDVRLLTALSADLGELWASVCARVLERQHVDVVALSGQTVWHMPEHPATLQIGEAARVLERLQVPVICDFRQSDMAAGGQGAPLVAFGDWWLFSRPGRTVSVHNLGGISNLTLLPASGRAEDVIAFDTGPANCLIDEACQLHYGTGFDRDGRIAASGTVDREYLDRLLQHPFLDRRPPKTTGRELFNLNSLPAHDHLLPADLIATLTAFTAESTGRAYRELLPVQPDEVILAGGGAHNSRLVEMIRHNLDVPVTVLAGRGLEPRDREALAFAVMGMRAFRGETNTIPAATGARHAVVAGRVLWPPGRTSSAEGGGREASRPAPA